MILKTFKVSIAYRRLAERPPQRAPSPASLSRTCLGPQTLTFRNLAFSFPLQTPPGSNCASPSNPDSAGVPLSRSERPCACGTLQNWRNFQASAKTRFLVSDHPLIFPTHTHTTHEMLPKQSVNRTPIRPVDNISIFMFHCFRRSCMMLLVFVWRWRKKTKQHGLARTDVEDICCKVVRSVGGVSDCITSLLTGELDSTLSLRKVPQPRAVKRKKPVGLEPHPTLLSRLGSRTGHRAH